MDKRLGAIEMVHLVYQEAHDMAGKGFMVYDPIRFGLALSNSVF